MYMWGPSELMHMPYPVSADRSWIMDFLLTHKKASLFTGNRFFPRLSGFPLLKRQAWKELVFPLAIPPYTRLLQEVWGRG